MVLLQIGKNEFTKCSKFVLFDMEDMEKVPSKFQFLSSRTTLISIYSKFKDWLAKLEKFSYSPK